MFMELARAGMASLGEYVAAHVLTCLVPAFLLAGAIVRFVDREAIIQHLGEQANRARSFSLAAFTSFFIAACSCTVIPVASGLYAGGAGIGVAFIVLWVAPSANILSLMYTGNILGGSMMISRVIAAILIGFLVGLVMHALFRQKACSSESAKNDAAASSVTIVARRHLVLIALIIASLLLPNYLVQAGSYGRKVVVWAVASLVLVLYVWRMLPAYEVKDWLRESGWFIRTIFPLLLAGVFFVGVIGAMIPPAWVQANLGDNSLIACFYATMIGSISYFSTMTEAPFVAALMNMGMGRGPALALLLTGPGLSLPNWIAIARVFGLSRAVAYVSTIIILGTVTGWIFGSFIFN